MTQSISGNLPSPIWESEDSIYPENWDDIARAIKDGADWKCVRCGHDHDPKSGHTLTVHHLVPAKELRDILWWNLIPICQRCHLSIQAKVIMARPWLLEHSEWFRIYAAGWYAHQLGEEISREEAGRNLDYYLDVGQPWRMG